MQAAFWFGLVVHFRIYPIIYSLPIFLLLSGRNFIHGRPLVVPWSKIQESKASFQGSLISHFSDCSKNFLTRRRGLIFGLVSASVFFFWTALFYYLYGWEFLNEALLYHLTRTDPRHNFSVYFYHIYLRHQEGFSVVEKLVTFLPQLIVQMVIVLCYCLDLPFCMFLQTVAFVAFNKVRHPFCCFITYFLV